MSKCTAAQAVKAMEYYIGYCEKATSAYASSRDKDTAIFGAFYQAAFDIGEHGTSGTFQNHTSKRDSSIFYREIAYWIRPKKSRKNTVLLPLNS